MFSKKGMTSMSVKNAYLKSVMDGLKEIDEEDYNPHTENSHSFM